VIVNDSDAAFHLVFSPPSPLISYVALSSFALQSATFASRSAFWSCMNLRSDLSLLTLSSTTLSSASFTLSLASTSLNFS